MGNEKQIDIELLEKSKSAFLPQEFQDPEAVGAIYSLEEEYAKTTKNRNWILYFSVFLFLALVLGGSIFYTGWLQSEGKKITIDISDFEDVRLLEMVNDSKQVENDIEKLNYELRELEIQYNEQIERLNDEYISQRDAVQAMDVSDDEKQAKRSEVYSRHQRQVNSATAKYKNSVSKIEEQIREMEEKLAKIKERIGAKGQIARTALGNKDELHNLQLKRLQNYYEDKIEKMNSDHQRELNSLIYKFNPSFRSSYLRELIRQRISFFQLPDQLMTGSEDIIISEKAATREDIDKVRKSTSDQIKLMDRLQDIPYQNSVPRTLLHSESLSKYSILTYDTIVENLSSQMRKKNKKLSAYNYAFAAMSRTDGETGFVLDTRNRSRMPVYVDPAYRPADGTDVFVFRNSEQIATAKIYYSEDDLYYIEPQNVEAGGNIEPLDNIMLRVTRE